MERGQTVTIICSNNAAGSFVPPGFIFPRVRMKPELTDGARPGICLLARSVCPSWLIQHNFRINEKQSDS